MKWVKVYLVLSIKNVDTYLKLDRRLEITKDTQK